MLALARRPAGSLCNPRLPETLPQSATVLGHRPRPKPRRAQSYTIHAQHSGKMFADVLPFREACRLVSAFAGQRTPNGVRLQPV